MKQNFLLAIFLWISACAFSQPNISADGPLEFCAGESVTLCADSGYHSYLWCTGSTTQCITVTESGDYCVTLLDSEGNIDTSSVQEPVTVTVHDPNPYVHIINDSMWVTDEFESYQWYMDGVAIPNATNSWYVVIESGYYNVEVTDGFGCYGFAHYIGFPPQAIERRENMQFEIFPNPTSSVVKVALASSNFDGSITVTDYTGKAHFNQHLPQNQKDFLIDVSLWPNGIYLISLQSVKGVVHTEKLIVQHE